MHEENMKELERQADAIKKMQKRLMRGQPIEPTEENIVLLGKVAASLKESAKAMEESYHNGIERDLLK